MRLEGRKALVTGGGSGIGAAIARRLAAEGAAVTIGEINMDGANEVAGEVSGEAVELDVTDLDSAKAALEGTGTVDILVNNAGTDEFGFFHETTPEQWQKVLAVNLNGVLNCTFAALPGMQKAGYGRIVNIASEAGRVGSKGSAVYSAAKGGVISFTKVMAREGARFGINVNGIAPGPIETPLLMQALEFGEIGEKIIENMKKRDPAAPDGDARRGGGGSCLLRLRRRLLRDRRDPRGLRRDGDGRVTVAKRLEDTVPEGERPSEATLEPGLERVEEFTVDERLVTDVGGTIGVRVLSTPGMIAVMERNSAVLSYENLPEGKATVGFEVCVKHVAAAAEDSTCTVRSTLKEVVDGRKIHFEVEVKEGDRTIGVGTHQRRAIDIGGVKKD